MPTPDLELTKQRLEDFFQELEREYYLEGAGLKDEIRAAEIYDRYRDLSSLELVRALREARGNAHNERHLRTLTETVVQSYLGNRTRHLSDQLLTAEASGTIRLEESDETMSFRSSAVAMMNEPDRERRRAIARRRDRFVDSTLNELFVGISGQIWAGVEELGYESYRIMFEELSGIDLDRLAALTERFLAETEDMYSDVLSWYARKVLGASAGDLEKHDLSFIARASDYDGLFPGETMIQTILSPVTSMGIDPAAGGRIRLDIEPRPKKSPRAFCSAVKVPEEVYLVIRPSGGIEDYKAFLHELGHALHFAHTNPGLPWEERRLGDNSITETYAMLFDHLLNDAVWLRKVGRIKDPANLLHHSAFIELMMLRRYSAKLAYEMELHRRPSLEGLPDLYRTKLSQATKVLYSQEQYLADVDAFFYAARYLRAWMLQASATRTLKERFDEDWFRNPRAGAFLVELWGRGQGPSGEELASEFGQKELTMDPLRIALEGILGS